MALVGLLGPEEFDPLSLQLLLLTEFIVAGGFGFGAVELRRSDQLLTGGFDELIGLSGLGWDNWRSQTLQLR